jgi:hypothetical protein
MQREPEQTLAQSSRTVSEHRLSCSVSLHFDCPSMNTLL